jgi:TrmH family RNA methyltransferase
MLTKNEIKFIKSLQQKKNRDTEKLFVAEGEKVLREVFDSEYTVKEVFIKKGEPFSVPQNIKLVIVSNDKMEQISGMATPPGILAVIKYPELQAPDFKKLKETNFLILDRMSDPGNLGTVLRTADWFGIKHVFCSSDTVDCYNPKVVQSSMGSVFRVQVHYLSLKEFLSELLDHKIQVYAAGMHGEEAIPSVFSHGGLLLGSESHGIEPELILPGVKKITIPKFGNAESLNVGVAGGILMWMMCGKE